MTMTRRVFVSQGPAAMAALGALDSVFPASQSQLVWMSSQWKIGDFRRLIREPARIKQVFDVTRIGDGKFLNNIKNALNGLHFGFDVPEREIKIAAGLHGPANLINYDDYVWEKYKVGEWLDVTDPATGRAATRNIFFPMKAKAGLVASTTDPEQPDSPYQDTSVARLQARGVQFLSCHTALEEQVAALVKRNKLPQAAETVVQDMLAHVLPGVLVVASMVAAMALLQCEGGYSYITV